MMAAIFRLHTAISPFAARGVLCALLFLLAWWAAGCAEKNPVAGLPVLGDGAAEARARAEALLARDPAGAVPAPKLPPGMDTSGTPSASADGEAVPYTVECVSPGAPELADAFTRTGILSRLADSPPESLMGLEQRLAVSLNEGRKILHSYGYYAGTVKGRIDSPDSGAELPEGRGKAVVRVTFTPGPQYAVGRTAVAAFNRDAPPRAEAASGDPSVQKNGKKAPRKKGHAKQSPASATAASTGADPSGTEAGTSGGSASGPSAAEASETGAGSVQGPGLPATLADVGLETGSPATADAVLDAVDRTAAAFRNRGYPFARMDAARYTVDHGARTLEADVRIDAGAFARMGDIRVRGQSPVSPRYLEALRTWTSGDPWNQEAVDDLHDSLRSSGLMRSISLTPAETADARGRRDVIASLEPAPPRTISGAVKYDSDFGPGVQGGWEHRNLTGRGDSLRLSMPLWMDWQELTARYRLPYFLRDDQAFIAQAGLLHQSTDAYDLRSAAVAAGVERRFSPHWKGSLQGSAEGGLTPHINLQGKTSPSSSQIGVGWKMDY